MNDARSSRASDSARSGERYLAPAIFAPLARELLDRIQVGEDDRILDVACGAGVVGREAAGRGAIRVTGLDISGPRLRVGLHIGPLCQASAEALPYRDEAFSLVTCQHGLMFFRDRATALSEAHRVLRPGGRFAASCWQRIEDNPCFLSLNQAIETHLGPQAAASAAMPFSLPDPASLGGEIEAAGFTGIAIAKFSIRINFPSAEAFAELFMRSTSLSLHLEDREEALHSILETVGQDLAIFKEADGVSFPSAAYLISGEKIRSSMHT